MPTFFFISKSLFSGKTLVRTLLEHKLLQETLSGEVIDLGSGGTDKYTKFIPREKDTNVVFFDQKIGQETDFESDSLPLPENKYDMVLFLNVLEHIFNHEHILKEILRVKKQEGRVIGFVPFLKWYHADPHDYFRYTYEALELLLEKTGYSSYSVTSLHIGPYSAAFDMILPTLPTFLRPFAYTPFFLLDKIFILIRSKSATRYALGYYFVAR